MKKGVVCPNCGESSRGYTLFCGRCGSRYSKGKMMADNGSLKINTGCRGLRNVLLLVFIVLGSLILWRDSPQGQTGTQTDAEMFLEKLDAIELALRMGSVITEQVTEQEINAYLADIVLQNRDKKNAASTQLKIRDVNIHITSEQIFLTLRADLGPLGLSYSLKGLPVQERHGIHFDVSQVKLGHLPIPAFMRDRMTKRVYSIFRNLKSIRKIIRNVSAAEVGDGEIALTVSSEGSAQE